MSVVFAVLAALSYGVGDFAGAQASRTRSPLWVLWVARLASLVALTGPLLFWNRGVLVGRDMALGCLGGALISTAIWLMYRSMTLAPIHFATPVAAVLAASVPAVIGVLSGDRPRPVAVAGVALAIFSTALISGLGRESFGAHTKNERLALKLSVFAGVLYGLHSVVFSAISDASGLWPVASEQTTGFLGALMLWIVVERRRGRSGSQSAAPASNRQTLPQSSIAPITPITPIAPVDAGDTVDAIRRPSAALGLAVVAGMFEVAAVVAFLEGSRRGLLSVVGAVVALYPAPTILLALVVLRERPTRRQAIGLAVASLALVAIGAGAS
jgi:drug/metabolite transporter (DMT)-like permease